MPHISLLYKTDLSDIMDRLLIAVESGKWLEAFPYVTGVDIYPPEDNSDMESYPQSFRSDEHAIAHKTVKHPDLHARMVQVVEAVIRQNNTRKEPVLASSLEHAGTHYATELALHDKQYVKLYADFLYSNDLYWERFQPIDFVRVIRRWGWCRETYYLLFARWLAGGDYCHDDVVELDFRDSLRDQLDTPEEVDRFLSAFSAFLVSIGYDVDNGELNGWTAERFKELVQEHVYRPCNFVFQENEMKAGKLTNRFPEVLEMVRNSAIIAATVPENENPNGWDWDDEDIPEI